MRYLLTALLLLPALVSAQELHTLKNGEVADAEQINQNFEALDSSVNNLTIRLQSSENIQKSGLCRIDRESLVTRYECGSSYSFNVDPEAERTPLVEIGAEPAHPTPAYGLVLDADDQVIAYSNPRWSRTDYFPVLFFDDAGNAFRARLYNHSDGRVGVTTANGGSDLYFESDNCSGPAYVTAPEFVAETSTGDLLATAPSLEFFPIQVRSYQRPAGIIINPLVNHDAGACQPSQRMLLLFPTVSFNLPIEVLNAAYPVRLEQLP